MPKISKTEQRMRADIEKMVADYEINARQLRAKAVLYCQEAVTMPFVHTAHAGHCEDVVERLRKLLSH